MIEHDKINAFNSFFSNASKSCDEGATLPADAFLICNILESFVISEEEVMDQIKIIDGSKSYGPDGISPQFIKIADNSLVKPLTKLYNLSLSLGKVPNIWKQANVVLPYIA